MSFLQYVVKKNWSQIKKDWREYQELRWDFRDAEFAVRAALDGISRHYQGRKDRRPKACIVYEYYVSDNADNKIPEQVKYECHYFMGTGIQRDCVCAHCEYADKNKTFHQACDKADKVRAKLNSFWDEKFANVK